MKDSNALNLTDPSLLKTQAYVEGLWCDADDGGTFDVTNPATFEATVSLENGVLSGNAIAVILIIIWNLRLLEPMLF